jgi:hypothetical protein
MMERKTYSGYIQSLKDNQVFVFGSNPQGRHGAGCAKLATNQFGGKYGKGRGLQGKSYGLITKNLLDNYLEKFQDGSVIYYGNSGIRSVSKYQIIGNIIELYRDAERLKHLEFLVAYKANSRNLCGYKDLEMVEMFELAGRIHGRIPINIIFEDNFYKLLING